MKLKKETRIGLIILGILAIVFWGFNFLKGRDIFKVTNDYYIKYDHIGGLKESSPVTLKGFKVGQVSYIDFDIKEPEKLMIIITIDSDVKIPKQSTALLYSADLMGSKAIELQMSDNQTFYKDKDTLSGKIQATVTMQLEPIKQGAQAMIGTVDTLLKSINLLLSEKAIQDVHTSLNSLAKVSQSISNQKSDIERIIQQTEEITSAVSSQQKNILRSIENVEAITDTLSKSRIKSLIAEMEQLTKELKLLTSNINSGQGTLGKLAQNDSLYFYLQHSGKSLDALLQDLKEHPKRYVHFSLFGKKEK